MDTSYPQSEQEWEKLVEGSTEEELQAYFNKFRRRLYWYWFKDASYESAGSSHKVDEVLY